MKKNRDFVGKDEKFGMKQRRHVLSCSVEFDPFR